MFCNFSSVIRIIYEHIDKSYDPLFPDNSASQMAFITALFCSYTNHQDSEFDNPTANRYFNNTRTLSGKIRNYYARRFSELQYDVTDYIIPWLDDISETVQQLYDLVHDDSHMKSDKKYELLSCFEQTEYFIAKVIHYAIHQPLHPKEKSLPVVSDHQLYFNHIKAEHKPPKPCKHFCGRDSELDELHEALQTYGQAFIHGIAGIGKSEFAKAYADVHADDYENIFYLTYHGDLETTIALLEVTGKPKSVAFNEHYKKLQSLTENSLIILDNFNTTSDKEKHLKKLLMLNCRLLITTRCKFDQAYVFELNEISDMDILLKLAENFFPDAVNNIETVTRIIEIVHHHTYAVELAARLLRTGLFKPDAVLEKLKQNAINPTLTDKIKSEKDNVFQKYDYHGHIHLLFSLFELSTDMQYVLRCCYFLSVEGFEVRQFTEWLGSDDLNAVRDLDEIGLLKLSEENILSVHPMVKDIVFTDLSPSFENCNTFMKNIYKICTAHGKAVPDQKLADILINICRTVQYDDLDNYLLFMEEVFGYFEQCELFSEMKMLGKLYTQTINAPPEKEDKHIAKMYWIQCACVGIVRKKYSEAIPIAQKALAIAESCGLEFKANMHHNLGWMYYHCDKFKSCKSELEKALAIYDQLEISTHDTLQTEKLLLLTEHMINRKRR